MNIETEKFFNLNIVQESQLYKRLVNKLKLRMCTRLEFT